MPSSLINKIVAGSGIAASIMLGVFFVWFFDKPPVDVEGKTKGTPSPGMVSRLTGQSCETPDQRPLVVMLAGDPVTRPLSSIAQADMVIEMPVTPNGVTRFMAVYQCEMPEEIGSIRSAREDFLPLAASLDSIYAHWGGEHAALEKLNTGLLDNIDALKYEGTVFYRKSGIKPPHNGFSTTENLVSMASKLKYSTTWDFAGYPHTEPKTQNNIATLTSTVDINYPAPFNVRWHYDAQTKTYKRSRGGTPENDAATQRQVEAGVVVVMKTTAQPLRDQYLIVETQGKGDALIYQQGTVTQATWRKDPSQLASKLTFLDDQGTEIPFAPGKVWIQIVAPL